MNINIYQGVENKISYTDVNIIIDVIRAFSVSYYAFTAGVKKIFLVDSIEGALLLKQQSIDYILSGEISGYKIKEFDYGNSPYDIMNLDLTNKILVQKTTNGVKATLNYLNADNIYVTGFVNYYSLIKEIKKLNNYDLNINIIASHPDSDDDLACADLLKKCLLNNNINIKQLEEETIYRILNSNSAKKFLDKNNIDFSLLDLTMCMYPDRNNFVMKLKKENNIPMIYKEIVC